MTDTQLPFTFTPEDFGGDAGKAERYNAGLKRLTLHDWYDAAYSYGMEYGMICERHPYDERTAKAKSIESECLKRFIESLEGWED